MSKVEVKVVCSVCGETSLVSKQSAYEASKKPMGYRHLRCAQAGKHKFPEEQRGNVYYLRLTLNSWRQKGNEIDPNWLNDSTQFINWVFLTLSEKGLTYEIGKFRFKRKDRKQAWSSQNIEICEV